MAFILIILGYLLGSIPFGFVLFKLRKGGDVRDAGSGATGATNVARQLGLRSALLVSILDIAKGAIAVLIAMQFAPESGWIQVGAGISAVIGHCFPVWIGFRGGKGVNTALGSAIVISWPASLLAIVVFWVMFLAFKYVSMASLTAVSAFSIAILTAGKFFGADSLPVEAFAIILPAIIIFTHRKNIVRLIRGEELKPSIIA
ncbi:MAG TPA: glycerol-3-phosphate 1-O-acyltransferase [candidate division Zixibacteria bacterium]|nr:glycerol-3-phosphate 1-O-acyltransferase [candidate division Zixibacteria bacterium]